MKKYCHIYTTCPCCNEPHKTGAVIKKISSSDRTIYRCSACDSFFYGDIDFKNFPKTWNLIKRDDYNHFLPLIWSANINIVEEDYINWINEEKINGKYLITWPWDDLKFIPILASEYIFNNPNHKVVVIDNFIDFEDKNKNITKPSFSQIFNKLLYFNDFNRGRLDSEINSECNKFNKKNILKKINKFHSSIKFLNNDNFIEKQENSVPACDFDSILGYKNNLKNQLIDEYLDGSIKEILIKESDGWKKTRDRLSENGFIEIKIDEREEWGGNLNFNKRDYWNFLVNIDNINRLKFNIKHTEIIDDSEDIDVDNQIFFIASNLFDENIFDIIERINPNLVIFNNADDFIEQSKVFYSSKGKSFLKFIKNTSSSIFLFSLNKDYRHLYGINEDNGFVKKYNFVPHTWDSKKVINELINKKSKSTAFSSSFSELRDYKIDLDVKYLKVHSLKKIEDIIPKIYSDLNDKSLKQFLNQLSRTPLYLKYDDNPDLIFERKNKNLESLMGLLEFSAHYDEYLNVFKEVYFSQDGDSKNPLLDCLVNTITELYEKNNTSQINIISHLYDKKSLENTLIKELNEKSEFSINILDNIEILTWNELNSKKIGNENEIYIISFNYPFLNYSLYHSKFQKYIFIGSEDYIDKTKKIIENRVDNRFSTPIYFLHDNAPPILKNIMNKLCLRDFENNNINDFYNEIYFDNELNTESSNENKNLTNKNQIKIKKGNKVLLLLNENQKAIFIPLKRYLTVVDSESFIKVKKIEKPKEREEIINKDIIINQGFYSSYKSIFSKFVVEKGKKTIIKSKFNVWYGFYDLLLNSSYWLDLLNQLVNKYEEEKGCSNNEAKDIIANILSESNIHASNKDYIKNFWLFEPEILETSEGPVSLYEIERPNSFKDLMEVFKILDNSILDIDLNEEKFQRCYDSTLILQSLRNKFLKKEYLSSQYKFLYLGLQDEIKKIISNSQLFKVKHIEEVKLKKDVKAFKFIENYNDYF